MKVMGIETYLLRDKKGYYWIWYKVPEEKKAQLNGPHSEKILNLPIIEVDNPLSFSQKTLRNKGRKE